MKGENNMKRIKVKLDVIEGMLYYWQATSEKEKVGESFLNDIANMPAMKSIYDDEFNEESVRRALSAISNREIFSGKNKKEGRFWNNNMWMLEDLGYTDMMVSPLKTLNLSSLIEKLKDVSNSSKYEEIEVIFVPGHLDVYKIIDNRLIINFFRVKPSLYDENTFIEEKDIVDFIEEKIVELLK